MAANGRVRMEVTMTKARRISLNACNHQNLTNRPLALDLLCFMC
jgi:hypothetical protein